MYSIGIERHIMAVNCSNNLQIGKGGAGNTFNISQNQFGDGNKDKYVQFEDDRALGVETYQNSKLKEVALPALLSSGVLFTVGLLGNLTGIFSFFGFTGSYLPVVFLVISIFVFWVN